MDEEKQFTFQCVVSYLGKTEDEAREKLTEDLNAIGPMLFNCIQVDETE